MVRGKSDTKKKVNKKTTTKGRVNGNSDERNKVKILK